jgi:hypothetical protein
MAVDYDKLIDSCMALRGSSRAEWENFVSAMQNHSAQVLAEMMSCPPEMLSRAQGMAMEAGKLAGVMATAPQLYEQRLVSQARKKNGNNHGQPKSTY